MLMYFFSFKMVVSSSFITLVSHSYLCLFAINYAWPSYLVHARMTNNPIINKLPQTHLYSLSLISVHTFYTNDPPPPSTHYLSVFPNFSTFLRIIQWIYFVIHLLGTTYVRTFQTCFIKHRFFLIFSIIFLCPCTFFSCVNV
jgi:hypothetical protein